MRLLSNLHVKGKSAVLPHRAIRSQSHYFIYRPCILQIFSANCLSISLFNDDFPVSEVLWRIQTCEDVFRW